MRVRDPNGRVYHAYGLADVLAPEGSAQVLLSYSEHYYAGKAAAIQNRYGRGTCVYLGTVLDDAGASDLLQSVARAASVAWLDGVPNSVEVAYRVKGSQRYAFYLNHSASPIRVSLTGPGVDLFSGQQLEGSCEIPGFDLVIVKEAG
jgi:beta-galactosidase